VHDPESGRAETVRYHRELYGSKDRPDSWSTRPSAFVLQSLGHVIGRGPLLVYDLGCGIGRHAVPIAAPAPAGSRVVGVDLLQVAIDGLRWAAADAGVSARVIGEVADLEWFPMDPGSADLIIGCSALEHVSSHGAFEELIERCQRATRVGGLHCFVIGSDRWEETADGGRRPARVEFDLRTTALDELVTDRFGHDWEILHNGRQAYAVDEVRDGDPYRLHMTTTQLLARRLR
jgi:SAM-dependent methyltransferase